MIGPDLFHGSPMLLRSDTSMSNADPAMVEMARHGWQRGALIACGWFFVALAVAGAVLPLLPTTPFLLLAAACFARSSQRFHDWLHQTPLFGDYLRRYRAGEGIPLRARLTAIALLWVSLMLSIQYALPGHLWMVKWMLLAVGAGVSGYLLLLGPRRGI